MKTGRQGKDIDCVTRSYYIKTKRAGLQGVMHGSGRFWTFGLPSESEIWQLLKYREMTFKVEGISMLDARGEFANGNRWRYLGMFFESASYSNVSEAVARTLDRFLDGACIKSTP